METAKSVSSLKKSVHSKDNGYCQSLHLSNRGQKGWSVPEEPTSEDTISNFLPVNPHLKAQAINSLRAHQRHDSSEVGIWAICHKFYNFHVSLLWIRWGKWRTERKMGKKRMWEGKRKRTRRRGGGDLKVEWMLPPNACKWGEIKEVTRKNKS